MTYFPFHPIFFNFDFAALFPIILGVRAEAVVPGHIGFGSVEVFIHPHLVRLLGISVGSVRSHFYSFCEM